MLHKISDFCKKIEGISKMAEQLHQKKYGEPKSPERDLEIQSLIDQIQADCYVISQDRQAYSRIIDNPDNDSL